MNHEMSLDLDDLTNAALKRLVKQLLTTKDGDEESILQKLTGKDKKQEKPEKNDLADLHEEMHGKPNVPMVEDEEEEANELTPDDESKEVHIQSKVKNGRSNGKRSGRFG